MILFIFILLCCMHMHDSICVDKVKIVGLVPVRNEALILPNCLRALACYTDAIVVLDDASDDNTLEVINNLKAECNIERIITKLTWHRDEPGDRNKLLNAGREIGGTHFMVIDADEIFTANCMKDTILRSRIVQLKPGEKLCVTWIQLWRSIESFRYDISVWSGISGDFIFCDDGKCFYESSFIHTSRTPANLKGTLHTFETDTHCSLVDVDKSVADAFDTLHLPGKLSLHAKRFIRDQIFDEHASSEHVIYGLNQLYGNGQSHIPCFRTDYEAGLMHFQFVNWQNLLIKQAWYRCLEHIRDPSKSVKKLNEIYGRSKDEKNIRLRKSPNKWFDGYLFFDKSVYGNVDSWQKKQVQQWFKKYGKEYFQDLDIWDINWS